jgi:hypothetical protein
MNILLERRYKYEVPDSIEKVEAEVKSLIERPWNDFSATFFGEMKAEHSFLLKPKNTFFAIKVFNIPQSLSRVEGNLQEEGDSTIINVLVRPNYLVLFMFYFSTLFFAYQTYALDIRALDVLGMIGLLIGFVAVTIAAILYSMNKLRKRFEKALRIRARL